MLTIPNEKGRHANGYADLLELELIQLLGELDANLRAGQGGVSPCGARHNRGPHASPAILNRAAAPTTGALFCKYWQHFKEV